jgi:uncharacterized protein
MGLVEAAGDSIDRHPGDLGKTIAVLKLGQTLRFSATDLSNHLGCRHLTALETAAAEGKLKRPVYDDPAVEALFERGRRHEAAYVEYLRARGLAIVDLSEGRDPLDGFEHTLAAMRAGADVIIQAWLVKEPWRGRADILRRLDQKSSLGSWSYEVLDTKLARETRAGAVLQLCLYSDVVGEAQGLLPETMSVVSPGIGKPFNEDRLRVLDYTAYYRFVRARLESEVAAHRARGNGFATYPEPVEHCAVCNWFALCDKRWRDDDHLSLVAGISRLQRDELVRRHVETLEALARIAIPLDPRPERGSQQSYARVHHQARVQLAGRTAKRPVHEILDPLPGHGLALLPEPNPGDVFLDLEGDPFVGDTGREYLFGWVTIAEDGKSSYQCRWSLTPAEEKAAFEAFVDELVTRWKEHPDFYIYHYAPYEPAALKRLMGRYATREDEVDEMLRARKFVDLYSVVRNGVRASVEGYSIKNLEVFYGYDRAIDLRDAGAKRQAVEIALELGHTAALERPILEAVEKYNRDDCISARELRDWLEKLRAEAVTAGKEIVRPALPETEQSEKVTEQLKAARALAARLVEGVPLEPHERSSEEQARWLLAQLLEWHRRERKAPWWEYFRLLGSTPEELLDEPAAISGLSLVTRVEAPSGRRRSVVDRYTFPEQEIGMQVDAELHDLDGGAFGKVVAIDARAQTLDVKKALDATEKHPSAVFAHSIVPAKSLEESLFRLASWVAEHGIDAAGPNRAGRDLLLGRAPRIALAKPGSLVADGEPAVEAAKRIVCALSAGVLPIQGPPGAGKTFTGARMICELVRQGKKVGVSAVSHKVIRKLLDDVALAADELGIAVPCVQRPKKLSETKPRNIVEVPDNEGVLRALASGEANVGGGTAWVWSRPEFAGSVDVLFIDEAGQMSLADVVAVAQAGASLVLLGDPQQLEQPMQGSHPEGTAVSALEHLLGKDHKTIPPDRGIFLPETWRLHPSLCKFTSELFYDGRLNSRPGLDKQVLEGVGDFQGAGLGSSRSSTREIKTARQKRSKPWQRSSTAC